MSRFYSSRSHVDEVSDVVPRQCSQQRPSTEKPSHDITRLRCSAPDRGHSYWYDSSFHSFLKPSKLEQSTDLSPNNILLGVEDASIFSTIEQEELQNPSPRKVMDDRVIHLSYTMPITHGAPLITDFGAARLGNPGQKHSGDVMPGIYRAPEVILGMEWDSKIDIWSIGVMVGKAHLKNSRSISDLCNPDLGSVRRWSSFPSRQGWPLE